MVDQVADIRDLVANLKRIVWDEKYDDYASWVAVTFTLIGLVPTVGSLVKGVCKAIWLGVSKVSLDDLLKVFNVFAKGNGYKWLKKLQDQELDELGGKCIQKLNEVLSLLSANLKQLQGYVPGFLRSMHAKIDATLRVIGTVRNKAGEMIRRVIADLKAKLKEILEKGGRREQPGAPRQKNTVQQQAKKVDEPDGAGQGKTPGSKKPSRPPKTDKDIDDRQKIHKEGTNEHKMRSQSVKGRPTTWKDSGQADQLTLDAYHNGDVTKTFPDGSPSEIKWNAGRAVGENGETQITVKLKQNGKLHGFPSGPKNP